MELKIDLIRAWKDEEYCHSLNSAQLASLLPNPAGELELSEVELGLVEGGIVTSVPTLGPVLTTVPLPALTLPVIVTIPVR